MRRKTAQVDGLKGLLGDSEIHSEWTTCGQDPPPSFNLAEHNAMLLRLDRVHGLAV